MKDTIFILEMYIYRYMNGTYIYIVTYNHGEYMVN